MEYSDAYLRNLANQAEIMMNGVEYFCATKNCRQEGQVVTHFYRSDKARKHKIDKGHDVFRASDLRPIIG